MMTNYDIFCLFVVKKEKLKGLYSISRDERPIYDGTLITFRLIIEDRDIRVLIIKIVL